MTQSGDFFVSWVVFYNIMSINIKLRGRYGPPEEIGVGTITHVH